MKDYMELGPSPTDEDCLPAGDFGCAAELRRYKALLEQRFGKFAPPCTFFKVKWFPHDFGKYGEVCVIFDDQDEDAIAFAFHCENNLPQTWQDTSQVPFQPEDNAV